MNRRLAEHKNRKGIGLSEQDSAEDGQASSNSRAAAAAARVAASYAKTPSYSEMQAAEARGALRAAEAATRAALEAQAAAQAVLDHIQNSDNQAAELEYEARPAESPVRSVEQPVPDKRSKNPDPVKRAETARRGHRNSLGAGYACVPGRCNRRSRATRAETWPADFAGALDNAETYEAVEAAQPIAANLIEFPREIVATRRMRPRITEAFVDEEQTAAAQHLRGRPEHRFHGADGRRCDNGGRADLDRIKLAAH